MATTVSNTLCASRASATIASGSGRFASQTPIEHTDNLTVANGAAAGQFNKVYSAQITVTAGTPLDLDLTALTNPDGSALAFTKIGALKLSNDNGATGQDFTLGGTVTNSILVAVALPIYGGNNDGKNPSSSSYLFWCAPNPGVVVDSTHKILRITVAAGTSVTGWLTVMGQ